MIREIRAKNFRLLKDICLKFEPGVPTVLIGPNSAGKSSFLEILHIFRTIAETDLGKALIEDRGGVDMVRTAGADGPISLEIVVEPSRGWPIEKDRGRVHYGFEIDALNAGQFHVRREWLDVYKHGPENEPLHTLIRNTQGAAPRLLDVGGKGHVETVVAPSELCIHAVRLPGSFPTLENIRKTLLGLSVYGGFDVRPSWVGKNAAQNGGPRSAAIITDDARLEPTGRNLVNVLHHLKEESPDIFDDLTDQFKAEFPFFKRFKFRAAPGGSRIQLLLEDERFPSADLFAEQMSDGMLHFLLILSATAAKGEFSAAIGLDEPESHIHPSAERRLVYCLEKAAQKDTIVVATHSSSFLNYLSCPAKSVRICEAGRDGAKVETLDQDKLDAWMEEFSLSELRIRGQLDTANEETVEK